jgi:L-rhamnonate dehydratase
MRSLPPDDLEGYAKLRDQCPIPVAGGEHVHTADDFAVRLRDRLFAIAQPDVCWCGGLTELLRIYEIAAANGVDVCPHRGSEVWALHAIAAVDPSPLAESPRPWMSWVVGQPQIVDGTIAPPDSPGFGVTCGAEE